jgi:membrane protease YdiL (CAAX protease family)
VIAGLPERCMALVGLGAFGPMAAAMIAARVEGTGIRAFFRPVSIWRVNARRYLAALALPGGIFVVAAGVYDLLGNHGEPLLYPPSKWAYVLAALVFPLGEEIGWRGFAFPRRRDRIGPLGASIVIGVARTFWHVPMLTLQASPRGSTSSSCTSWWAAASSSPGSISTRAAACCSPCSRTSARI